MKINYNNINLKERGYSPITHKRNAYVDNYRTVNSCRLSLRNESKNMNYFEEFNVIIVFKY